MSDKFLTEESEARLDKTQPHCHKCKKQGGINHTLTVVAEIKKKAVWFNEVCYLQFDTRRQQRRAKKV